MRQGCTNNFDHPRLLDCPPVLPSPAGLPSQVAEVRGLAVDTTCKLAAAAGPALLRPHMPALVPAMLEGLSGLEDVRLNYLEQHAERIGLDAERLEGARVAASQGGPIGETLDLCARCGGRKL